MSFYTNFKVGALVVIRHGDSGPGEFVSPDGHIYSGKASELSGLWSEWILLEEQRTPIIIADIRQFPLNKLSLYNTVTVLTPYGIRYIREGHLKQVGRTGLYGPTPFESEGAQD